LIREFLPIKSTTGLAINIDEYVPMIMPSIIASANRAIPLLQRKIKLKLK